MATWTLKEDEINGYWIHFNEKGSCAVRLYDHTIAKAIVEAHNSTITHEAKTDIRMSNPDTSRVISSPPGPCIWYNHVYPMGT